MNHGRYVFQECGVTVRFVNIRDKEEPVLLNEISRSWGLKEGRLVIIANRLRRRRESSLIFSLVGPWRV